MSKRPGGELFHSSLLREFAATGTALFVVLIAIVLVTQLVRLLDQAASGALAVEGVAALLGFRTVAALPVVLTVTLFGSVLLSLSRGYRDSEMVVWFASGQSLLAWIRPVLAFAAPLVVAIGVVSLGVSPWAVRKAEDFREILSARDELAQVTPGVFRESRRDNRVFFIEGVAPEAGKVTNIFVQSVQHGRDGVIVAREGKLEKNEDGDRFVVLLDGTRYEGEPGSAEYRFMSFKRYSVRIEQRQVSKPAFSSPKGASTLALLRERNPTNLVELGRRIGFPVSALLLVLAAIPLSFVNPRVGRSLNLVLAIFVYMIYSNLLSVTQVWVAVGKLPASVGLWGVHVGMLVVVMLFFYRRLSVFSLSRRR